MARNLPTSPLSKIDEVQIFPRKGQLYQLRGGGRSGKSMRHFAEAWAAMTLMNGDYVHWIDGACRFNPARIIKCFPHTLADPEQLLHGLFVGRGFTVHQFSHLIDRLYSEIKITRAKLIVVDGPITPTPGPIFAKQEREMDTPSINVKEGSRYKVTNEPRRKIIINMKKKTPTFLKRDSSNTFLPILNFIIALG